MTELEKKRLKLELIKVNAAKAEFEFKIEERLEDINRIKEQIKIQDKRMAELESQLKKADI